MLVEVDDQIRTEWADCYMEQAVTSSTGRSFLWEPFLFGSSSEEKKNGERERIEEHQTDRPTDFAQDAPATEGDREGEIERKRQLKSVE